MHCGNSPQGIRVKLENDAEGFIPVEAMSDFPSLNEEWRVLLKEKPAFKIDISTAMFVNWDKQKQTNVSFFCYPDFERS